MIKKFSFPRTKLPTDFLSGIPYNLVAERSEATHQSLTFPRLCPGWDSPTSNLPDGKFSQAAARDARLSNLWLENSPNAARFSSPRKPSSWLAPGPKLISFVCARGGTRTHKSVKTKDFKSFAYANSSTRAKYLFCLLNKSDSILILIFFLSIVNFFV